MRYRVIIVIVGFLLVAIVGQAQEHLPASVRESTDYIRSARLGITHISLTGEITSGKRYENALMLGAGWNRWPLYWNQIETEPGEFYWDAYDRQVADDLSYGFQINAILLGRPEFYKDDVRITGLNEPIFSDGSDYAEPDKEINPDNPWANFVWQAVRRYMPGGELAREEDWPDEWGIRVWEVWNEPDFELFWQGTFNDYARLLKTTYIVAKMVDPKAQIMFGGLLYNTQDNWLARVLAIIENDPFHEENNWYMDMVAVHNYTYPWRSGWLVLVVSQTLKAYKLDLPIWLNESGVPAWDDYPGPVWAESSPDERRLRATAAQQAAFFIQSSAYAWANGADVIFFHQLYDDCGNQPPGTDFAYTNKQCPVGSVCSGDAYGLFRNERSSICFSQSLAPGTARPAAGAFRLIAEIFGAGSLENPRIATVRRRGEVITFDRPETNQRISVMWNRTLEAGEIPLPASGDVGTLYSLVGSQLIYPDSTGLYHINLPAATLDNYPKLEPGDVTAIGGSPFILVETITRPPTPMPTSTPTPTPTPTPEATEEASQ
jgi:hypothetical protein